MEKPTKTQVRSDVILIVSAFTTLKPGAIRDTYVLKSSPMLIDDIGLGFLAASLRGYIKQFDRNAFIKANELRKSGLTVGALVTVIQQRLEAK